MELTILHLYPRLMSLYGEWANVAVLRRHLEALGVEVDVRTAAPGQAPELERADLIYMGAGTERAQKAALGALLRHVQPLEAALERGALLLLTGNAMELPGTCITGTRGQTWPALSLAEFSTEETERRVGADVVARSPLLEHPAVGFMNKCSVSRGIETPLFDRLERGFGNEAERGGEGYAHGNILATHLTGPVLAKNPELTDLVIRRLYAAKGWDAPEQLPALPHEREAWRATLDELTAEARRGAAG